MRGLPIGARPSCSIALYNRARPVDQSERGDAMIVWCRFWL